MPDKNLRDEIAELTEAVRDLREDEVTAELRRLRAEVEQLRAERSGHQCHGCTCNHLHITPAPYTPPAPFPYDLPRVWCGTVTSGSGGTGGTVGMPDNYTVTAVN